MKDFEIDEDEPIEMVVCAHTPSWTTQAYAAYYVSSVKLYNFSVSKIGENATDMLRKSIVATYNYTKLATNMTLDYVIYPCVIGSMIKTSHDLCIINCRHDDTFKRMYGAFDSRFEKYEYSIHVTKTGEDLMVIPGNIFIYEHPVTIMCKSNVMHVESLTIDTWNGILYFLSEEY